MRVVSLNIAQPKTIVYNGREEQTGIYKVPVNYPVMLTKEGVVDDHVIDKRYHGGSDKACYGYGLPAYHYWKTIYPDMEMPFGLFGENITAEGLNETHLYIGQVFTLGEATIQVSQPRIPCYKLGIRFNDKSIVRRFQQSNFSGVYFRVLKNGHVSSGDEFIFQESDAKKNITVSEVFGLFQGGGLNRKLAETALNEPYLAHSIKTDIRRKMEQLK